MKKKIRNTKTPINKIAVLRVIAVIIILAVVATVFFLVRSFFTVKTIDCQLLSGETCSPELISSLDPLLGSSMFFEDYSQKFSTSQSLNQPVSLVTFKKELPNSLLIVFQQEPTAYTIKSGDTTVVVSKTGRIFTHQMDTTGLMLVEMTGEFTTSEGFVDSSIHQSILGIILTSSELQLPLTQITWVDKSTIKLSMENRTEVFIIDSERPSLELNKISLVLKSNEYRNIEEPKQELDVRFTMPVLRTQP